MVYTGQSVKLLLPVIAPVAALQADVPLVHQELGTNITLRPC